MPEALLVCARLLFRSPPRALTSTRTTLSRPRAPTLSLAPLGEQENIAYGKRQPLPGAASVSRECLLYDFNSRETRCGVLPSFPHLSPPCLLQDVVQVKWGLRLFPGHWSLGSLCVMAMAREDCVV